jgi:hypothetical protein
LIVSQPPTGALRSKIANRANVSSVTSWTADFHKNFMVIRWFQVVQELFSQPTSKTNDALNKKNQKASKL